MSRLRYLSFLAGLIGIILPVDSVLAGKCSDGLQGIINANARQSAAAYRRPHQRNTEGQYRFLGTTYQKKHETLKPGDIVFDSGAGFGISGLEDAAKGYKTFAINAQDFWKEFQTTPLTDSFDNAAVQVEDFAKQFNIALDRIPVEWEEIYDTKKWEVVKAWTSRSLKKADRELLRSRILDYVGVQKKSGNFSYLVGFSEAQIPKIRRRADLIRDLYGGYFYSADRIRLLELYYTKLAENGLAAIRLSSETGDAATTWIQFNTGQLESLAKVLETKYPTIFRTETVEGGEVLIMRKEASVTRLGLSDHFTLDRSSVIMRPMNDTEVPEVRFLERKP